MNFEDLRRYIAAGQCPWCPSQRSFTVLAAHTYHQHGISAYELREMAGLNRNTSICDPDYSRLRAELQRRRPPEALQQQLAAARGKYYPFEMRTEGRDNQLAYLRSPEHIEVFNTQMEKLIDRRSEFAKKRSPEAVSRQTERIIQSHAAWRERVGPEKVREQARHAGLSVPHDIHVRAGQAAAKRIPELHKDPVWKERWRRNLIESRQKTAKVPRDDYPLILKRHNEGESSNVIAADYSVCGSFIRRLIRRMRGQEHT